ncbi:MAG: hypothetical protein O3C40_24350 [Planctomycetota bacterium]|nr:hypothetical protein [Planctomycetota bacterium]
MNQSSDEARIREMVQRLKRVDEQHAPAFADVLGRPVRKPDRRLSRRLQLAAACCIAATLLVAFWFVRPPQDDPVVESGVRVAEDASPAMQVIAPEDERVADIDFDHLRRVIEEHFSATATTSGAGVPVWTSRTESLLALNLNVPLDQE